MKTEEKVARWLRNFFFESLGEGIEPRPPWEDVPHNHREWLLRANELLALLGDGEPVAVVDVALLTPPEDSSSHEARLYFKLSGGYALWRRGDPSMVGLYLTPQREPGPQPDELGKHVAATLHHGAQREPGEEK